MLPPKEKALNKNVQGKPKNTRDPCAKKKAPECKRIPEQPPQAQNRAGSALGIFFHPDCTVGFGVSPNHALRLVGCTTGRESHPALKNSYLFYKPMICTLKCFVKVFLIIKNNIVKEIVFLALYVVWFFVSVVIILAACTISIVSAILATVISITSISLVIDIVFATAAVF